jgi:ABC-type branched-subunit amino acid transport system ATPase component
MRDRPPALSVGGMQNTAIEVHDLYNAYDGQPVLRGVSVAVGGNGIFGIAGRNGAGRTTTVEILQVCAVATAAKRVALCELGSRSAGGW